jgi:hypothetical protein
MNRDIAIDDVKELEGLETDEILDALEDSDEEPLQTSTEEAIGNKYDTGQARIVTQRNDFLVPNILQMMSNNEILNIAPEYQRRKRWDSKKKSHLIESLLMNIPIPPVFLYEHELARYEVMDGQQRLDTIRGFFNNEFPLSRLKKWGELNGRRFSQLPTKIQAGLQRRGVSAVIILTESGQTPDEAIEIRRYVFERLNTGGEKLNAQEVRNCIYASPFNRTLNEIARSPQFTSAWGIPPKEPDEPHKTSKQLASNRLYATMADCEIVLRFFALQDVSKFKGGLKRTFDAYMELAMSYTDAECSDLKQTYLQTLDLAAGVFGTGLFRLTGKDGELTGKRSVPLSDAVLLAFRPHIAHTNDILAKSNQLRTATRTALQDPAQYEVLVGRGNTKQAIVDRIAVMTALVNA